MLAIFPPLLFLAALTGAPLTAQDTVEAPATPPPEYASPRATMFTFLRAVNAVSGGDEGALDSATAAMDLAGAEIDPRSASGRRAARDLWSALNHLREVQASELPAQLPEGDVEWIYFPRPFNDADEQILARVNVGNRGIVFSRAPDDRWLFSAETIRGIGELSAILAELPRQVEVDEEALDEPAWVRSLLPLSLRTESFLGLRPWQWLGLFAIIFIGRDTDAGYPRLETYWKQGGDMSVVFRYAFDKSRYGRTATRALTLWETSEFFRGKPPLDLERDVGLHRGALYGLENGLLSTSMFRPRMRSPILEGLYLAGSSVHLGGGIPVCIGSGMIVADMVTEDSR